jgi:hypothetical protein
MFALSFRYEENGTGDYGYEEDAHEGCIRLVVDHILGQFSHTVNLGNFAIGRCTASA